MTPIKCSLAETAVLKDNKTKENKDLLKLHHYCYKFINKIFIIIKFLIFSYLSVLTFFLRCSRELSYGDCSFEYTQQRFWLISKKNTVELQLLKL